MNNVVKYAIYVVTMMAVAGFAALFFQIFVGVAFDIYDLFMDHREGLPPREDKRREQR
jgi:hypothetical protein